MAQEKRITIQAKDVSLADVFAQIEQQTGYSIAYGQSKIDVQKRISLSLKDASPDKALTEVLKGMGLSYKINGYHIILIPEATKPPQSIRPQPAKRTFTINGRITDGGTSEVLIGCNVAGLSAGKGATTNSYGLYSLTLPQGNCKFTVSYMGYENFHLDFVLKKDTTINISLTPSALELQEVSITATNRNLQVARLGNVNVSLSMIKETPALLGESDLMKSLQYIPGVQNTAEGKSDLSVRGGSPDQNLILLDGIPIYNANHVFGFLSVFNTDALKNVTLYKSGFPARFGGRLSSVIDITTKDGNKDKFTGSATLGLLALKVNLEAPVIKDRTSFTFSARRSLVDLYLVPVQEWLDDEDSSSESKTNFFFYDINAKIHHKLNERTSLYAMAYNGRDKLENRHSESADPSGQKNSATQQDWKWGNTIFATRLNTVLSPTLFMNTTLSYNQYRYNTSIDKSFATTGENGNNVKFHNGLNYDSGIKDYAATADFEYIPASGHYIRAGASFIYHDFKPEVIKQHISDDGVNKNIANPNVFAKESGVYVEDDWDITPKLRLNAGVRASLFNVDNKTYYAVDPRLAVRYMLSDRMSVKAGYTHMQQYIHLLSSNSLVLQTDMWVPVTASVRPMNSQQISIGGYYVIPRLFDISVEAYYKNMRNVIEYKDGASFAGISSGWENKVEAGEGRAYGIEFSLERKEGRTTGILSYALAKSERRFTEINNGKWFPARFDRRHTVNFRLTHQFGKKIDASLSWVYSSGDMATLPMMTAVTPDIPDAWGIVNFAEQLDHRNNYRMPAQHRLDLGVNYTTGRKGSRYSVLNFSIYNVYNRMNPFKLYIEEEQTAKPDGEIATARRLMQISLFPIMPSISYTYHF
ncbi:TonB-dependent receptor [Bacteroides sp. UBA939]|uniref:TonB-dependent receptor n=1 Tax=Bacteroides sp. UBA939 TaxID=1946092 RepID=UPI0025B91343|nr:TonB-dependent receptor [Bacteroides sp. UBA939]